MAVMVRPSKYRTSSYWAGIAWSIVRGVLVAGICFIIIYPLLIKISSSLMTEADLYDLSVKWFPRRLSFQSLARNYQMLYHEMNYGVALINSILLALFVSVLQLISCSVIGYGFARFKYFGSNFVFALVILTLLVPPQMIMVPMFLNFRFLTWQVYCLSRSIFGIDLALCTYIPDRNGHEERIVYLCDAPGIQRPAEEFGGGGFG